MRALWALDLNKLDGPQYLAVSCLLLIMMKWQTGRVN